MNSQLQTVLPLNLALAAGEAGMFGAFLAAVTKAGLAEHFAGAGPITIFAPTDTAFAQFPTRTWESFEKTQTAQLRNMLLCHFVPGLITSDKFATQINVKTLQGAKFAVDNTDQPRIGSALITHADIVAENGVLHGIDNLLWFAAPQPERPRRGGGGGRDDKRR
jgi:uncharacterized surface protein with fasciclin (FAS1) repeats